MAVTLNSFFLTFINSETAYHPEVRLEAWQTSIMELFTKVIKCWKPLFSQKVPP